jgi:hypothetical protein
LILAISIELSDDRHVIDLFAISEFYKESKISNQTMLLELENNKRNFVFAQLVCHLKVENNLEGLN